MAKGKIDWYEVRIKVPKTMHSDLKCISNELDMSMSDICKPKIRETIEGYSHFLPVGSNRTKEKED